MVFLPRHNVSEEAVDAFFRSKDDTEPPDTSEGSPSLGSPVMTPCSPPCGVGIPQKPLHCLNLGNVRFHCLSQVNSSIFLREHLAAEFNQNKYSLE